MSITWEPVLDDLEREVERAERIVASAQTRSAAEGLSDWEPPADLGPLPHHLVARAQDLLERQQAVTDRIRPLLLATRQQLQIGQRFGRPTARPATPVYLDVTA
ncbi:hypothetical protein GCM10009798_16580 [Nocardioides panacihumi]|uniref:Flagellar protein FliT n=1 Tax=Nocardioides panacihumi TaxID=400774 RepID=A0ABN2QTH1_9ACTN